MKINKVNTNSSPILVIKIIENDTMYSVQKLHLFLCVFSYSTKAIFVIFTSPSISVHF